MRQLKLLLSRLKNPSVVLSFVSQIMIILYFCKVDTDGNIAFKVYIGICVIFVILGILSNPCTKNFGYGDDILTCKNCDKNTRHILIEDNFICEICGHKFQKKEQ